MPSQKPTTVLRATRRVTWDAAHRLMRHDGKCATLHGHRYVAEITCEADTLDGVGLVVDFGIIKERVGNFVREQWDHTTLLCREDRELLALLEAEAAHGKKKPYVFDGEPSAENIAQRLFDVAHERLADERVRVVRVRVYESERGYAEAVLRDRSFDGEPTARP